MSGMKPFWPLTLSTVAVVLALVVVLLGGWTRINDAGLGCPDWPTCYGQITPPDSVPAQERAKALYPDQPLVAHKGWLEMIHRYVAGTLGLLILVLAIAGWRRRHEPGYPVALSLALLCLVIVQALFGMWTVTLKLLPPVVTLHLLGGVLTLTLLVLLRFRLTRLAKAAGPAKTEKRPERRWILAAILMLFIQIALGGWTSSNYAGWACTGWLHCERSIEQPLDFAGGFTPSLTVGPDYQGGLLPRDARAAIQMTHRAGAVLVVLLITAMLWRLATHGWPSGALLLIAALVSAQVSLGIANVLYAVPVPLAFAHHLGAILLLLSLLWLFHQEPVVDKESRYVFSQSC